MTVRPIHRSMSSGDPFVLRINLKQRSQATFFRLGVIFLSVVVLGTVALSVRTGASLADTIVAITAVIGVYALYAESRRGKSIAMGEFILNLNQTFTDNVERAELHRKLISGEGLDEEDKPSIVTYLTFFEIVYRLINNGVVRIDVIDDLFRSRFFKAAHHVEVQNLELLPDADGYRNIYELERLWLKYLEGLGIELKRGNRVLPTTAHRRASNQVRFSFTLATQDDVGRVHELISRAAAGIPPDQFYVNDRETLARQMDRGFTILAYLGRTMVGILHVYFPTNEESYAQRNRDAYTSDQVAHMDIAAVLPEHRGYGLLELLLIEAESRLRSEYPDRVAYYATVAPTNGSSVRSFEFSGYHPTSHLEIHGTYPRTLFRKEIPQRRESVSARRRGSDSPAEQVAPSSAGFLPEGAVNTTRDAVEATQSGRMTR